MREIFTDKNFRLSKTLLIVKIILIATLVIFYLPLLVLPFFNHATADDFYYGFTMHKYGFEGYQHFIYTHWDGRFVQTFITAMFVKNDFLFSHYFVHSLLLLALNIVSAFTLMRATFRYIFKEERGLFFIAFISFIFVALELACMPEISTYLFWFSSAITYQLPVIFLQFEIAFLILLFHSPKNKSSIYAGLIALLIVLTIGLNELFLAVQLLIFLGILFFNLKNKKIINCLFVFAYLLSAIILVFAPGNKVRMGVIDPKGFFVGVFAVCYHSTETIWYIFKTPFFWLACFIVFIYAQTKRHLLDKNAFIEKLNAKNWLLPVGIIIFLAAAILLPVIALKGGVIPDRYINALICCFIPLLLIQVFFAGITINAGMILPGKIMKRIFIYSLIIIGLLCNSFIVDAYKSIMIAPVYHSVMSERETELKQASSTNKIAVVNDYNLAINKLLKEKYNSAASTLQQIIIQKPPFLFFQDDLQTKYSIDVLKNYYRLDSIVVKRD